MIKRYCRVLIYLSLMFAIVSTSVNAKVKRDRFLQGDGRFLAEKDDSLDFIKKQLLFNAFKDVISKEIVDMGLDSDLFWEKFSKKMDESFNPVDEKLKKKYKLFESEEIKAVNAGNISVISKYKNKLRLKKLNYQRKFGNLLSAVISYSIKKQTRSTQNPNFRYISVSAKINRKTLNSIYYKFTHVGETRHFSNIFVTANYYNDTPSWELMGVSGENDFTSVINQHWTKWLSGDLRDFVDNVKVTDESTFKQLDLISKTQNKDIITDDIGLKNSLWLKVNIKINYLGDDTVASKRAFKFSLEYVLVDIKTGNIVSHYDFSQDKISFSYSDTHNLSSNLASSIYRMPIQSFMEIKKKLGTVAVDVNYTDISVENLSSIKDLLDVRDILLGRGVTFQIDPVVKFYDGNKGILRTNYSGDRVKFMAMLAQLNSHKVKEGKIIELQSLESPNIITLKDEVLKDVESDLETGDNIDRDKDVKNKDKGMSNDPIKVKKV